MSILIDPKTIAREMAQARLNGTSENFSDELLDTLERIYLVESAVASYLPITAEQYSSTNEDEEPDTIKALKLSTIIKGGNKNAE